MNAANGKECLVKLKGSRITSNIPVIIYSGFVSDRDKLEFMNLGAFNVFIKSDTVKGLKEYLPVYFKHGV